MCVKRFVEDTFVCIIWLTAGTSLVAVVAKINSAHLFSATYMPDLLLRTYVPSYFIISNHHPSFLKCIRNTSVDFSLWASWCLQLVLSGSRNIKLESNFFFFKYMFNSKQVIDPQPLCDIFMKQNLNRCLEKSMNVRKIIHPENKNCYPYWDLYPLLSQLLYGPYGPKNTSWVICTSSQSNGVMYSNTWYHLLLVS